MPTAENSLRRSDAGKSWWMRRFLDAAGTREFCFVECGRLCAERIEIYLYHWNRDYPAWMCIFRWTSACGSAWRRKNLQDLPRENYERAVYR